MLDELGRRISESIRFGVPLAVMRIDVEGFLALEKSFGEAVGDLILDSVVAFTRSNLRDMDLLARMARGQFGVMLPGSGVEEATVVARRIATALEATPVPIGGKQIRLTVNVGVARAQAGDEPVGLLERATQSAIPLVAGAAS